MMQFFSSENYVNSTGCIDFYPNVPLMSKAILLNHSRRYNDVFFSVTDFPNQLKADLQEGFLLGYSKKKMT